LGAPLGGGGELPGPGTLLGGGAKPLGGPASPGAVGEPLVGGVAPSGDNDAPGGAFVTGSEPAPIDVASPAGVACSAGDCAAGVADEPHPHRAKKTTDAKRGARCMPA